MIFFGRAFEFHHPPYHVPNFFRLPHVELDKILSLVSPGNETARILTRPPVYPADLLSRRFREGGGCYTKAYFVQAIG